MSLYSTLKQQQSITTHYPDAETTDESLLLLLNNACLAEKQQIPIS
jgi:hypothetical protein